MADEVLIRGGQFGGGLLHVWNHGLMKGLLFLAAGSVLHGTGTRDVERLGGVLVPRHRALTPALRPLAAQITKRRAA